MPAKPDIRFAVLCSLSSADMSLVYTRHYFVIAAALVTGNFIGDRYGSGMLLGSIALGYRYRCVGLSLWGICVFPMICFSGRGYSKVRRLCCGKSEVPGPKKIVLDTHRAGSATFDGLCAFG